MILHGIDTRENITKNFTWKEALWIAQMQAFAVPTAEQLEGILRQAEALQKVRDYFGKPITVTSWLRTEGYNKYIGGAPRSFHVKGLATDFIVKGVSCDEVRRVLMKDNSIYPGRGEMNATNWVHLDLGGQKWFVVK